MKRPSPSLFAAALLATALAAPPARGEALDTGPFAWRVPIAASGYAGAAPLTNFPVLVTLAAGSPAGFDYADCAEDGSDLRFADADGAILPHEIDTWDPSGESFVWVGLPVLTNGAAFSLYYGAGPAGLPAVDPADVWTRYAAVVHGGSGISDSSSNALAVANGGGVEATSGSGVAGGGLHKSARNSKGVNIPNPVLNRALSNTAKFTLTTWYKSAGTGTSCMSASKSAWGGTGFLLLCEKGTYMSVAVNQTHQGAAGKGALAKDQWAHVAFSYDTSGSAGSLRTYFDGENIYANDAAQAAVDGGAAYWTVGSYADAASNDSFVGDMDEIRIFDGIASADWIRAEHDSVADPAAFAVRGAAAPVDGEAPRLGALAASDEGGTATFSVPLAAPGFGGAVPTAVSVFYGTNGVDWTELSLGSTNAAATLAGSTSGLTGNVRYLWYAVASATQDGATKTATSPWRSFVSKAVDPAGNHMSFTATVDWDGAPAENVPVLLRLSEAAVRGFYYGDVTSSGFEIVDAAGRLLPFEIDTWDENGESLVWVLLPDYRDGATFTVRYGADFANAPAPAEEVWSDYKGVWHMDSASPADVSGSGNDGTAAGAAATAPGRIGSALSLQATTDYVTCGTSQNNSELAAGFTVEGWANFANLSGYHALFGKNRFVSIRSNGSDQIQITTPGKKDHDLSVTVPTAGTWGHFALTFQKNTSNGCKLYVNGALAAQKDAGDIANLTDPTEMWLGRNEWGNGQNFQGLLDEMRLRAGIRSANEIAAEYHAMADAAALVCGAAEPSDADLPVIGNASAAGGAGSAAFSVALDRPGFGGAAPTSVSVFYGTNGVDWTELVLGSTNEAATLTGTATGLRGNTVYLWYAAATATQDGVGKSADTSRTPRTVLTGALPAPEAYRTFTATVEYDGAAATNVPVLLRLSENAIEGFDYDDVTASGFEIVDADGRLLPFEIDTWNTNGESLLWVRLPVWEDGATIVVRYGAEFANSPTPASGTWADYAGVWHLNDTNAASAYGSYPNSTATAGIDGEKAQASIADEAGVFGKSVKICDAARQGEGFRLGGVFVPDSGANSPLDLGDTFVLSGWFRHKNQDYYYDKLFAKRGKANNDANVPPTGAFTVETGSEGSSDKLSVFGGGGTYKSVGLNSTLRNVWSHLAFVYDGSTVSVYQDGAPCGSGTVNPVTDNDGRLCFGNMTGGYGDGTGDCAWCGWIDEVRLADGTPSAAWIAAEYAAMADPAALSYSRATTIDAATPELSVPTVARGADGSFAVSVVVSGNVPASVACLVGGSSVLMSTSDAELPMTYSADLSHLADGTYLATARAISTTGNEAFSDCPAAFHVGALSVEVLSDADEGSLMPGVFRVSRADAAPTGLPALTFDVAFSGDGLAAVVAPGIATAAIPAGAAYVDIAVAPVHAPAVDTDTTVSLAVSGAYVGRPSGATMTVVNAAYDPAVRYVSTIGSDENHGGTPEWPKKTIGAAVASLENVARTETCTVHVAPGLYPNASPIEITKAIRVLGDDPDPSRTVVSNIGDVGFYGSHNQRLFTINHADAFIANLTMQAGIAYYDVSGGNFYIGEKGGTVSNCVVEAGVSHSNGIGGGGQMKGGLVTHTVFRKNRGNSSSANGFATRTGVLEMNRTSRAENCLFEENPQTAAVFLIKLNDQSVMRNCTIANSSLSATNEYCRAWSALSIASGATAQNVVIAGVTNTVDGLPCPPTGTLANFLDGAFDGDASALPAGTVTGTVDDFFPRHADADAPLEARYRPAPGSPLRDAGAGYAPLPAFDLSGRQPRLVGAAVDIGCYEDAYLDIEATGEPTVGLDSFATDFAVGSDVPAAVSIVWSADDSFAAASTNRVAEGVTNGVHEASIGDLEPDTLYWWKLVADNGAFAVETAPASFRTLGAPTFGEVKETVSGPTAVFSVALASLARDELGNGLRTYVSVYYTTNGTDYAEKPLGYAAWARTLVGSATLPNGDCTWYARAYADYGGRTIEARTGLRTFRVFHNAAPPAGFRRLDATIAYAGEPAEDIPVLLRLSESIEGFRYADVANNGKDFLFSDQDGNLLPFEIDVWDPAGESLVWVRVPVFADGTVIHLDYGASEADGTADAADVWRRYVGVWHLDATNAASAYGSYPNSTATAGIDGEKAKASIAGQTGRFGRSVKICNAVRNGPGYRLGGVFVPDAGENSPLDLGPTFVISGWFKHEDQDYYWDKMFAKRKSTNNEGSPNGAFSIEMDSAGSNSRVTVAGNGGDTGAATLDSTLRNAWSHLGFVFDGKSCAIYQDGAFCRTTTISAVSDNDAPLCFGNLSGGYGDGAGDSAWCGWIDEVRLADGVPTAAWLAAEYAAMAPGTNVVRFAAVRELEMPVLAGAPELAWAVSSFRYAATVAYGLGDVLLTTVDLYDGSATTNGTHSFVSTDSLPQPFSDDVSLGENRMYRAVAVLRSPDGAEEDLAAAEETVYSGQLAATWVRDADVASMTPAIVRLARADTPEAVCAPLTVALSLSGEAVSRGLLEAVVSATIPAGTNSVDVALRPIARSVEPGDYTATLAVAGTNVANPAGTRAEFGVRNAGADPYVRFVAPNGDDGNDGALATSPKRTIASALASFSEGARSVLCTVHVAPGLYPIESPIVLSTPVRVLGDDPDPSRAVVSNTVGAGWTSGNHRVFTIDHPDALVANLTMQDGSVWGDWIGGGDFLVDASGGTVSNCIVEAGHIQYGGHAGGGGARLEAGLVTHTVFRRNYTVTGSSQWGDGAFRAGVLMLAGKARAENCLLVDNPQSAETTIARLDGSATMRNCTIVDSGLSQTNDLCKVFTPLRIQSASATVLDTVVAGVTNTVDGAPCLPTGHVSRFRNGAVDGSVEGLGFPAETIVGTSAAFFRARARGDYRPKSGGPLVAAGANYEPMAGVDLTGVQPRKVGSRVDIGCYEAFAETTILILK